MIRSISSISVSASSHVSASSGTEDGRACRISAGNGQDAAFLAWIRAKVEHQGFTLKPITGRGTGTTFIFEGTVAGKVVVADLTVDFGTALGLPKDTDWTDKLGEIRHQRTYWLGTPRVTLDLGAFGE